jgi:hypothetical protein
VFVLVPLKPEPTPPAPPRFELEPVESLLLEPVPPLLLVLGLLDPLLLGSELLDPLV